MDEKKRKQICCFGPAARRNRARKLEFPPHHWSVLMYHVWNLTREEKRLQYFSDISKFLREEMGMCEMCVCAMLLPFGVKLSLNYREKLHTTAFYKQHPSLIYCCRGTNDARFHLRSRGEIKMLPFSVMMAWSLVLPCFFLYHDIKMSACCHAMRCKHIE